MQHGGSRMAPSQKDGGGIGPRSFGSEEREMETCDTALITVEY